MMETVVDPSAWGRLDPPYGLSWERVVLPEDVGGRGPPCGRSTPFVPHSWGNQEWSCEGHPQTLGPPQADHSCGGGNPGRRM